MGVLCCPGWGNSSVPKIIQNSGSCLVALPFFKSLRYSTRNLAVSEVTASQPQGRRQRVKGNLLLHGNGLKMVNITSVQNPLAT